MDQTQHYSSVGSLGILGGMGPKATAVFFDRIIERTQAECDQEHMDMLILNHASIPDRTETIATGEKEQFLHVIAKDFALFEHANVSNIAIPCNTSHYYFDEMQQMTSIPIIHMIDETWKVVYHKYGAGSRAAILATNGTVRAGVYAKSNQAFPIQLVEHDEEIQKQVMDIIYNDVKSQNNCDPAKLESLIDQLINRYECDCIILACTELSCIPLSEAYSAVTVDAMNVLVDRAIELSGRTVKDIYSTSETK